MVTIGGIYIADAMVDAVAQHTDGFLAIYGLAAVFLFQVGRRIMQNPAWRQSHLFCRMVQSAV